MRILPDSYTAAQDQAALYRMVCIAVECRLSWKADADNRVREVMLSHLSHPAVVAAAHTLQRIGRSGKITPEQRHALADELRQASACAAHSVQRISSGDGLWRSVDLAVPQPHLRDSVTRALAMIPARGGDDGKLAGSEVTFWRDADQVVFRETVDLLHAAWPQMLAELREMIHQVALLRGDAIDGFTDFTVHGAVMINQARLTTGSTGLPGSVRLAEALVHEGTHTRCNAAQLVRPFLRPAGGDGELVMTPLRADPRPLAGLFQQLVVLVRSALLYRRLPVGHGAAAHLARQDKLIGQAHQGAETLARYREVLTDHGREILTEATTLLEREFGAGARQVPSPANAMTETCSAWHVEVFAPFPESTQIVFGRVAARSAAFGRTCASGGAPVLIGNAAGHDAQDVAVRARGELLERMSNVLAGRAAEAAGTVVATFEQLRRRRAPAVDPVHWGGPEAREASQLWVAGESLLTGAEALVPAGVAFLHHRPPNGCQAVARAGSTGVAAHPDAAAAADHAAWEIFERDLVRRSWYDEGPAPTVMSENPGLPAALEQLLDRLGLRLTVLLIPAPAAVGCIVACLCTPDGHRQSFGARCGPVGTQWQSIEKAAYEALMVRWSMNTPVARSAWEQWEGSTLPRTAVEHALWALHRQDNLRLWLDPSDPVGGLPVPGLGPPTEPLTPPARLLATCTSEDVIVVDTTAAPARAEGIAVTRVVAPGTHPLPTGRYGDTSGLPHPFG